MVWGELNQWGGGGGINRKDPLFISSLQEYKVYFSRNAYINLFFYSPGYMDLVSVHKPERIK